MLNLKYENMEPLTLPLIDITAFSIERTSASTQVICVLNFAMAQLPVKGRLVVEKVYGNVTLFDEVMRLDKQELFLDKCDPMFMLKTRLVFKNEPSTAESELSDTHISSKQKESLKASSISSETEVPK